VSSINLESKAGGSTAASRVSQAGQIQRLGTDALRFLTEGNSIKIFSDTGTNDVNMDLKHKTNYARDGS
jgi:hypothetical protein